MKMNVIAFAALLTTFAAQAAPGEYWEVTKKYQMFGRTKSGGTERLCLGKGGESFLTRGDEGCSVSDVKTVGPTTTWSVSCNDQGEVITGVGEQTTTPDSFSAKVGPFKKASGRNAGGGMVTLYEGKLVGGNCDAK